MKWIVMMLPLMLAGCAQSQQPDAPPPPNSIGMANPAAVYCDQKGGKQVPVQTPQGCAPTVNFPVVKRSMNGNCGGAIIRRRNNSLPLD